MPAAMSASDGASRAAGANHAACEFEGAPVDDRQLHHLFRRAQRFQEAPSQLRSLVRSGLAGGTRLAAIVTRESTQALD